MKITSEPGSYIIIGCLVDEVRFNSGPFSGQLITCGYYLYSGSAFSKGGLNARITRHLNPNAKRFWHFDHLKAKIQILETWYSPYLISQECQFIKAMRLMENLSFPFPNFGSGDCRHGCPAHLAWLALSVNINTVFTQLEHHGFSLHRLSF